MSGEQITPAEALNIIDEFADKKALPSQGYKAAETLFALRAKDPELQTGLLNKCLEDLGRYESIRKVAIDTIDGELMMLKRGLANKEDVQRAGIAIELAHVLQIERYPEFAQRLQRADEEFKLFNGPPSETSTQPTPSSVIPGTHATPPPSAQREEGTTDEVVTPDDIKLGEEVSTEEVGWLHLKGEETETKDEADVYISEKALVDLKEDLKKRGSKLEAGGVGLGYITTDPRTNRLSTRITRYLSLPEDVVPTTSISSTFTPDAWRYANMELNRLRQELPDLALTMVAWVHSHPGWGVFLSADDDNTNRHFQQPGQVAIVYDPIKDEVGFFSKAGTIRDPRKTSEDFIQHRGIYVTREKLVIDVSDLPPAPARPTIPSASEETVIQEPKDQDAENIAEQRATEAGTTVAEMLDRVRRSKKQIEDYPKQT